MPIAQSVLKGYQESANRAVAWLHSQLNADGTYAVPNQDLACYYKSPYLFSVAGKGQEARRVLRLIRQRFMLENGDFSTSQNTKSENSAFVEYWAYMNGWIALTAQKMGCFEVAFPAYRYLQSFSHTGNGGFTTRHPYGQGDRIVDVLTTAHLGLVALYFGDASTASAAGKLLHRILGLQPHPEEFLLRLTDEGKLESSFPSEAAVFFRVSATEPNQAYFMLGYPIAFLAKLSQATGDSQYLDTAEGYLAWLLQCRGNLRAFHFSHKVAWGAAILGTITNDERYLELAQNIADYLVSIQDPNGGWLQDQPAFSCFDQTAEIAIWLKEICHECSAP